MPVCLYADVIIHRLYREGVSRRTAEVFKQKVVVENNAECPIVHSGDTTFFYTRVGDIYVVATTTLNANPALIFQYIFKLVAVFRAYFGGSFDATTLTTNFVLVYELLDEMMDHGYPQLTSAKLLKQWITLGTAQELKESKKNDELKTRVMDDITNKMDWRPGAAKNYFYRKNEVYIDIMESVNVLVSATGEPLKSDVSGKIVMKTFLSGMPECMFGMNDKLSLEANSNATTARQRYSGIAIDDVQFHRCVGLKQFDKDRTITFIPPDGEFELMKYRITQNIGLPFKVTPHVVQHGRSRVEYKITMRGAFPAHLEAKGVVLRIPTPPNTGVYV
jgi:AP-2 complex subunit mu-1